MAKPRKIHVQGENRLLAALPRPERERLLPHMEKVSMNLKEIIFEANGPITHVYFPLSGVVSLVLVMSEGPVSEVATIGNEGLVGTPVFLGSERSPTRAICQVDGEALRMEAAAFVKEIKRSEPLHDMAQRFTQAMIDMISQSAVCHNLHSVEERMCRWLLMTHDRVGTDEFPMTQEFLAHMLGVHRPTVTLVASTLQRAGFVKYRRGRMTVLDREGLEDASCECYGVIRKEFERLLG